MSRSLVVRILAAVLVLAPIGTLGTVALAQGTSASVRGRVENEGGGLPGTLVTLKSPTLQGERTATSSANGDYSFSGVPPGDYTIAFTLQGFEPVTKAVKLTAGTQVTQDASMVVSGVTAATVVTARAETVSTTTQASTTITSELTNKLPITRTILSEVALASGVTQVTSLGNAFAISGGQTFDNLFMVDGAVIIDNIRGTPNNLFIEDAIQETTTSVSSVSSEFGRFQGGVVNTITKSGGNTFSGSFRTTLANDAWTAISPSNETRIQHLNPRYEATLGGPFWKDHVWFFGSGRLENRTGSGQTSFTNINFATGDDQKRYQAKLTLTPLPSQTLSGSYLKVTEEEQGNFFGVIMDSASLVTRQLPQEIVTANYNGVMSSNFFVEGLYSSRKFAFQNSGSVFTDLINGTLMRDRSRGNARYNSPTFCGVCDPEERNNRDILVKGTYFLSTPGMGSHNLVLGYDNFSGQRKANNYQSGSNYRLFTTSTIITGGDIFPVVTPASFVYFTPIFALSKGTDALTHSVFLNDSWRLNDRLSASLGVRYDKNHAANSLGAVTADDSAFSSRLAVAYDVTGTGSLKVGASYAHYVGAIQDSILDSSSSGGQPGAFYWYVSGAGAPVINSPQGATLTTRAQALQSVFNWFFAQGCPDLATCKLPLVGAFVPGLTNVIPTSLKSPYAREYTIGVNGSFGGGGSYRMDFVRRDFYDFYNQVLNRTTGVATDVAGNHYDVGITGNTNDLTRNYTGLQTQLQYRLNRFFFGANWTWSHTLGNFDGETGNSGPVTGQINTYPEYKDVAWYAPKGSLATDQRHRVRAFFTYDLPFIPQRFGSVSISGVQAWETGTPYGAVGAVRSSLVVTNPGYNTRPASVTYYYTARDAFHTDDLKRTDISLNFSTKIGGFVELFIQPQITNLFNNKAKLAVDATVQTAVSPGAGNTATSYANFNPFTQTPVQGAANTGANWNYGPNFGKARTVLDYQNPRTFIATMGLRF